MKFVLFVANKEWNSGYIHITSLPVLTQLSVASISVYYGLTSGRYSIPSHPSIADESWYWPKHILHNGGLCIQVSLFIQGDMTH